MFNRVLDPIWTFFGYAAPIPKPAEPIDENKAERDRLNKFVDLLRARIQSAFSAKLRSSRRDLLDAGHREEYSFQAILSEIQKATTGPCAPAEQVITKNNVDAAIGVFRKLYHEDKVQFMLEAQDNLMDALKPVFNMLARQPIKVEAPSISLPTP